MTKIKLCGLSRECDIETANKLLPDYIGFVLAKPFRRYVAPKKVQELRKKLDSRIQVVGVFVDEEPEEIARLLNSGIIDLAQLHGKEDEVYINKLRSLTDKKMIKAFKVDSLEKASEAERSSADYILLDAGCGTGTVFDWDLVKHVKRPYFLAGGLHPGNAAQAIESCGPYGLDVSSGIETDKVKDKEKMCAFVEAVRNADRCV